MALVFAPVAFVILACLLEIMSRLTARRHHKCRTLRVSAKDHDTIVQTLNARYNSNPLLHVEDPHGYEKCMVFMHVFDLQTSRIDKPWLPPAKLYLQDLLHMPFHVPTFGVSFSAMNRSIVPENAEVLFNVGKACGGMIFVYDDGGKDRTISPRCFYTRDAATAVRLDGGCSPWFGVQTFFPKLSSDGYWQEKRQANMKFMFGQTPLRFKEFVTSRMAHRDEGRGRQHMWNEVVFPNWSGMHEPIVPLVAFFANEGGLANTRVQRDMFATDTGILLPIVSFDPQNEEPYELI